jgi:Flp pilus assembly protein TadD
VLVSALNNLGVVVAALGDLKQGRALLEQSLSLVRESGDKQWIAIVLGRLGDVNLTDGDVSRAQEQYKEGLALAWEMRDHECLSHALQGLAKVLGCQGQAEQAARLFGAVGALREASSIVAPPCERANSERHVAAARAKLDDETFERAWSQGKAMSPQQAVEYALKGDPT